MIHDKKVMLGAGWVQKRPYEYKGEKFQADLKDQDIIQMVDGGVEVQKEFKGTVRRAVVHKIKTRNGVKLLEVNQTTINNLIDAYGKDSENWIDKELKVWIFKVPKDGKMSYQVFLTHPDAEMEETEDGRFHFTGFGDVDNGNDIEMNQEEYDGLGPEDIDLP